MKTFVNTKTSVRYEVQDDKVEWFEREKDFSEVFPEPKEPEIKNMPKMVKPNKSVIKKEVR